MESLNMIKDNLKQHYGSENIYHGLVKNCCYSEGVKDYYRQAKCYWLHDILQTEFHNAVKKQDPDTYYLSVKVEDTVALIVLEDYKKRTIYSRFVEFTTHPDGEMNLHFGWDGQRTIICLPQEN